MLEQTSNLARVVTADSNNAFVTRNEKGHLAGICVDLWQKISEDLNLTTTTELVSWPVMYKRFQANQTDVILQRISEGQLRRANISESE